MINNKALKLGENLFNGTKEHKKGFHISYNKADLKRVVVEFLNGSVIELLAHQLRKILQNVEIKKQILTYKYI